MSTKIRALGLLLLTCLVVPGAGASTRTFRDANDSQGRLDVKVLRHGHSRDHLKHSIVTFDGWRSRALKGGSYITILISTDRDRAAERTIGVDYLKGSLRGVMYSCTGCEGDAPSRSRVGRVQVGRPDRTTLRIKFAGSLLANRDLRRYGWYVITSFVSSRSESCSDTDPCDDLAPDLDDDGPRYVTHRV